MTLTAASARPEQRVLLHSALTSILAVALATVSLASIGVSRLHLGASYLPKVLAVFALGAVLMVLGLVRAHPFPRVGPANQVTLVRCALVALLAGLVVGHGGVDAVDAGVAAVAALTGSLVILLDGVDGWLARHSSMVSEFGARFDMETDAVFVAVLALLAWQFGKVGSWVLLSGLMRYLFVGAVLLIPRLRLPVPPTYRGKTIAVLQMIALIVAIAPGFDARLAAPVAAVALLALTLSFALDVIWLLRQPASHAHGRR